jgi:hypothetical protein
MSPDLEALLQAWDAYMENPRDKTLYGRFLSQAQTAAEKFGVSQSAIIEAAHLRYPAWVKAQRKPPTIPPKA